MYEDKTLVCKDCGAEFVFTAGEQEFYAEKGFVNEPKRCKSCRDAKKNASGNKPEREMFKHTGQWHSESAVPCFVLYKRIRFG